MLLFTHRPNSGGWNAQVFEGLKGVDIKDGPTISQKYGYESSFMAYLREVGYEFLVLGPG